MARPSNGDDRPRLVRAIAPDAANAHAVHPGEREQRPGGIADRDIERAADPGRFGEGRVEREVSPAYVRRVVVTTMARTRGTLQAHSIADRRRVQSNSVGVELDSPAAAVGRTTAGLSRGAQPIRCERW